MTLTRVRASKNLALGKFEAEGAIDEAGRRTRARFATEGKHTVYAEKRSEAEKYMNALASGEAPEITTETYPYISNEVGVTAETPLDLCELWLYMDRIWKPVAATIENITMKAKAEVKAAGSQAALDEIAARAAAYLDTIGDKPPERPKPKPLGA